MQIDGKLISQVVCLLCSHIACLLNEEFISRFGVKPCMFSVRRKNDMYAVSSIKHLLGRDFHGLI